MIEASIIADQPDSQAIQEAVEIIQLTRYKHIDQNMSTIKTEKVANPSHVI